MNWKQKVVAVGAVLVALVVGVMVPVVAEGPVAYEGTPGGETLEDVLDFVQEYGDTIALIGALVVTYVVNGFKRAKALGLELMLEAEKVAREEVEMGGPEKMKRVLFRLLAKMPPDVRGMLDFYATLRGTTVNVLVEELAQNWYNRAIGHQDRK
jgi:hypothetical protein